MTLKRILFLSLIVVLIGSEVMAQDSAAPKRYALVVGVTGYPNFPKEERLQFADRDAQLFSSFIQSEQGGAFPTDHVRLLVNQEATRARISKEISWIGKRVHGEDLVYVFFAGHGIVDDMGQSYLMPYDGDLNDPSALGFRADLFLEAIRSRISAKHLIIFVDACHASAALSPDGSARESGNITNAMREAWSKAFTGKEASNIGFFSASSNQRSWEDKELKQGLFTYYTLTGLKGEADSDDNKVVTAAELYRYVLDHVEEHSKRKYSRQTPLVSHAFNPDFPLAVVGADVVKRVFNPAKSNVKPLSALAEYDNDPEAARCLVRVDKALEVNWYTTPDIGIVYFNFNYKNTCSRPIQGAIAVAIGSKRRSDEGGWEMADLKISEFFLEPNNIFNIKNTLRWAGRGLATEERMPAIRYADPPKDMELIRCQFLEDSF